MEKYKLVYVDDNKVVKGSLNGRVNEGATDTEIIDLKNYAKSNFKKVYEKTVSNVAGIYGSTTNAVSESDVKVLNRDALEGVVNSEVGE